MAGRGNEGFEGVCGKRTAEIESPDWISTSISGDGLIARLTISQLVETTLVETTFV
jgi:hypothetical protein